MEKSLFQHCLEKISSGYTFRINFAERTLKVDGKSMLDKDGNPKNGLRFFDEEIQSQEHALELIRDAYIDYYYSRPSERSSKSSRFYFVALSLDELPDNEFIWGEDRQKARFILEYTVLVSIITGKLKWEGKLARGSWYYKEHHDGKDRRSIALNHLIIRRSWIDGVSI